MESTLWSAPLVYRSTGSSQTIASDMGSDGLGLLTATALHVPHHPMINLGDVLGAEVLSTDSCLWQLHAYPVQNRNYTYRSHTFACPSPIASQQWVNAVNSALRPQRRSLTILLNPNSGNRKSLNTWQKVKSIFEQAGCQLEVFQTQSAKDLKQRVSGLDLETCSGLIILGGDGSIHHAVNGLMAHPERKQAIQLPLGFIPTGTSNGLVKSILDDAGLDYSVQNAAIAIAFGKTGPLDLIQVDQDGQQYFSILSFSWGFFSDVDLESDRMKWLGFFKNYLYTFLRLITYRTYSGHVEIKIDADWQTLSSDFISLWTMNVPWAAYNFKPAPRAGLNDAAFDVWITPNQISRWTFLKRLLQAFDGNHLNLNGVDYYKVQGIKVLPYSSRGYFAIDGESVPYTPMTLEIFPHPLSILRPGRNKQEPRTL